MNHKTLICLQADQATLTHELTQPRARGFVDTDLNDMLTAVAVGPLDSPAAKRFSHLRLA